mgnify:CR=1 FL=1
MPRDLRDLVAFVASVNGERLHPVGLGSNLLVRDGGYRGTVVLMHSSHGGIALDAHGKVCAEAGVASASNAAPASHASAFFISSSLGS